MKIIATSLILTMAGQLIAPNMSLALTTGPSQPEVQAFEPVGTSDMVDMFSGSFVYNIPLLDVEGYPVNISYHGGVTMEQEASWVGLGWSLNPGAINRTVRGVPDDFNGDSIFKDFNIKPEKLLRVGVGVGIEYAGMGDPDHVPGKNSPVKLTANLGANLNISNYRGVSVDFNVGAGINIKHCASAGVNLGVGSQSGAGIDYNLNFSASSSKAMSKDMCYGVGVGVGGGYSTRSGIKDLNFSVSVSASDREKTKKEKYYSGASMSSNVDIPIGVKNYIPVITNSSFMQTYTGRVKLGGEAFSVYGYGTASAMYNILQFKNDASRGAYGYMYLQNAKADNSSILDFTRDKDGMFNESMRFLPVPHLTYDIYSVSGQGTGGIFREYRNDFGSVYDPYTSSSQSSFSGEAEVGIGNLIESGWDVTSTGTEIKSGPWTDYLRSGSLLNGFTSDTIGKIYENHFFKAGGELTVVNPDYYARIGGTGILTPDAAVFLPVSKPGSGTTRDARANLISYHRAEDDTIPGVGTSPSIYTFDPPGSEYSPPMRHALSRIGTGNFQRKKDQISEITQTQKDGRRYIYGLPAMNNVQREVTFSVDPTNSQNRLNLGDGAIHIDSSDIKSINNKGREHYYNSTVTPSYAHSYLLTSVLSNDYVDLTGDGPTDDDQGSFTRFNYTRTDSDYRWVAPYAPEFDSAQYNPGYWSDPKDDKASIVCGSREQWYLHSIETKNFIAEFYSSARSDGMGISKAIGIYSLGIKGGQADLFNGDKSPSQSYKLDSIKLYNKHDRFINRSVAIPIKSVYFVYDSSLCTGIPNTSVPTTGKLTLKKIYFSYGNSQKSLISPYQFSYGFNPAYNLAAKDRWSNYKPNNTDFTNYEFPYVNQNDTANATYASAWSLETITLPSGGVIHATYESGDYAFVQDRPVMEMFMIQGFGNSRDYINSNLLFADKNSPMLFAYFKRRPLCESPKLSFLQNYLGDTAKKGVKQCIYFNVNLSLTEANNTFEQIKGYGNVIDAGICQNDTTYGFVQFTSVNPKGGGATLSPITYTALNEARFNLPQVVFPGSDPDQSDWMNIVNGLAGAWGELTSIGRSPVIHLVEGNGGRNVNLSKSFVRLQSVGLQKKGGGQRVSMLTFSDSWNALANGSELTADYGKKYDYSTVDSVYGRISAGVASYEPLIGGDENPFRQPVPYTAQSGSDFPANDPVDLYQETPIGESLYPCGQVGYSHVTVTSIHADKGRSSQGVDQYEFYTAKDFPVQFTASTIDATSKTRYDFFSSENRLTAKQSYTLVFNDMHGKPRKVEHDVYNTRSQTLQPLSYQLFRYKTKDGKLDNNVQCMVFNGTHMAVGYRQLGVEADVTMDSREKDETSNSETINGNMNTFILPLIVPVPVVIPTSFTWSNKSENKFQSVAVTKVVQQYGILDNIISYNEGATTTMQNEIYDPVTGQPVVSSITNEYKDKEFSTSVPAYWVYKGMGPAYTNIGYHDIGTIAIGPHFVGTLNISNTAPLVVGDELSVRYTDVSNTHRSTTAWILGVFPIVKRDTITFDIPDLPGAHPLSFGSDTQVITETVLGGGLGYEFLLGVWDTSCSGITVLPRFPGNTPGWTSGDTMKNVRIEIVRSGQKNMLTDNVESYTSLSNPIVSGVLTDTLTGLIALKARTFSDSNTRLLYDYIANPDTVNPFGIGERGIWRPLSEYAYKTDRNYLTASARNSGLFSAVGMLSAPTALTCFMSPYNYFMPSFVDNNWHNLKTVSKYSSSGKEIENIDALGVYSTAVYGFNQELPIAVAYNARQGSVLAESFEEYGLLQYDHNLLNLVYSPFNYFNATTCFGQYDTLNIYAPGTAPNIYRKLAHSGKNSLFIPSATSTYSFNVPVDTNTYSVPVNYFNSYFYNVLGLSYLFGNRNEYAPFRLIPGQSYVLSVWVNMLASGSFSLSDAAYVLPSGCDIAMSDGTTITHSTALLKKTNVIDRWQQFETAFTVPGTTTSASLSLPGNALVDDLRIYPAAANMKTFVYHPYNERLMATLDENNIATFYEYDQEGNLCRVKKETSSGIMTVSESRSGNPSHP